MRAPFHEQKYIVLTGSGFETQITYFILILSTAQPFFLPLVLQSEERYLYSRYGNIRLIPKRSMCIHIVRELVELGARVIYLKTRRQKILYVPVAVPCGYA